MRKENAIKTWDYLIVTASNDVQAQGYQSQLEIRQRLGLLEYVRNVMVVPDPDGNRIGSGGSTLCCLMSVLGRELADSGDLASRDAWFGVLQKLRILIVHAGGDSQRLPAYGPCGKIFVPVPGEGDSCLPTTLFDRQLPVYLGLPASPEGVGQVVITAGDVLMQFDSSEVSFDSAGVVGLGCLASPEESSKHGVYVKGQGGAVKSFLQKPSVGLQQSSGAIDKYGQSLLDVGVVNFDAATAIKLLDIFGAGCDDSGRFEFSGEAGDAIHAGGLDFYREICCAMGSDVTFGEYLDSVKGSGSVWSEDLLKSLFESCREIDFQVQALSRCDFLHFGTSRQLISSGNSVIAGDRGTLSLTGGVEINNAVSSEGYIQGSNYWVEGCSVDSSVSLGGYNLLVGVDVDRPLELPQNMCLESMGGRNRNGEGVWFTRIYGIFDSFKESVDDGGGFCNMPLEKWMKSVNVSKEDLWPGVTDSSLMTVFRAKLFPALSGKNQYHDWLWMFDPSGADDSQISAWHGADRYSISEMAHLSDNKAFFGSRQSIRADVIKKSLRKVFRLSSEFSSDDLIHILSSSDDKSGWVAAVLDQVCWHSGSDGPSGIESFIFSRIIHTLGSALRGLFDETDMPFSEALPGVDKKLNPTQHKYLSSIGLDVSDGISIKDWCERACGLGFTSLSSAILSDSTARPCPPKNSLRKDEIVWGRSPARLDVGGGWTDTPPYSLEYGGSVVNVAVDLNGQPPIQAYAKVIDEPVIRICSIDLGARDEITNLEQLLDYRMADSSFGLAKAAIALCGFSPESADWPEGITLEGMLKHFGGGLEITTLAAIPKGSGLGTSSIVGAVLISVIKRVMGQTFSQRELFNAVLKLEQSLTTGGGWQDQVGGATPGAKIVTATPAIIPDARIHYLTADVIDPVLNSGQTLVYYTGITRLAKNILEKVVGRYLNRKRHAMATLRQIYASADQVADAMSRKDIAEFGRLVDQAWQLNVQLDPNSSNPAVEELLARVRPYIFGAKLLGAGGGGFLLMVAKSPEDAKQIRQMLENEPPNERARFFDYSVNTDGLTVTVC